MLVTSIIWQIKVPALYEFYAVKAGRRPFDAAFVETDTDLLRTLASLAILFYSTLWLVKLSFLMFFRRLGSNVQGQRIWWWFILIVTALTWVACIADTPYKCFLNSYMSYIICEWYQTLSGLQIFSKTGSYSR